MSGAFRHRRPARVQSADPAAMQTIAETACADRRQQGSLVRYKRIRESVAESLAPGQGGWYVSGRKA